MNDNISIIMPAYNVGKYIENSIRSIQQQSYPHWRLLVINDGSTDNTSDIVQELAKDDSRINLLNQKNAGVANARNKGLSVSTGKYITFLDGDDIWNPHFLSDLISAIQTTHVSLSYCGNITLYPNGKTKPYLNRFHYENGNILLKFLQNSVSIANGAFLLEKELLTKYKITFFEGCRTGEDVEFLSKILCFTEAQSVENDLMTYVQRKDSACNSIWNWSVIDKLSSLKRMNNFIKTNYNKDDKDLVLQTLNQQMNLNLYRFLWKAIKHNYHANVLAFLMENEWQPEIHQMLNSSWKLADRIKINIITSQNKKLWTLLTYFK